VPEIGEWREYHCELGTYQPYEAQTSCLSASPGYYVLLNGQAAETPCWPGSYYPYAGGYICYEASAGHYAPGFGDTAQTECPPGTYQPSTNGDTCDEAEAGHFVASSGRAAQTPCSPGSYNPYTRQPSCLSAQTGFYVSETGSLSETPCPAGDTTAGPGSTSASQCSLKPLAIETTSLPGAKRGTPYSDELKASGGIAPYTWKKVGSLPKGLKLTTTGVISGTLSTKLAPLYPIRVKVTDSRKKGNHSVTATLMLSVS
jgi:hypothetical protein